MTLFALVVHLGNIFSWPDLTFSTDDFNVEEAAQPPSEFSSQAALLDYFQEKYMAGRQALALAQEDDLERNWTMRSGKQIMVQEKKRDVIRIAVSHIIHHRAQLGVFLRLLNIPIPGSYGPSRDELDDLRGLS